MGAFIHSWAWEKIDKPSDMILGDGKGKAINWDNAWVIIFTIEHSSSSFGLFNRAFWLIDWWIISQMNGTHTQGDDAISSIQICKERCKNIGGWISWKKKLEKLILDWKIGSKNLPKNFQKIPKVKNLKRNSNTRGIFSSHLLKKFFWKFFQFFGKSCSNFFNPIFNQI